MLYILRAIDRRPVEPTRRVSARNRLPLAWAGFRGAVSLAAALSLPLETRAGDRSSSATPGARRGDLRRA
ncbi:MAG TPA: hypothetical protein VGC18_14965 [Lacisediminihabitans sp.]|uniref:hypothetical protein n=1 Tax=Lacisediminihabitans sp. TaxID=2787631 RepID=UPI002ED8F3F1